MKIGFLRALFLLNTCAMVFAFALISERRAYAYGDPGAGLLILQSLGSALMGFLLIFRNKLAKLMHRNTKTPETQTESSEKPELTQK